MIESNRSTSGLKRLWDYADSHRKTVVAAIFASTMKKVMDVVPEIIIGAVIDVIVRGADSFVAVAFGLSDRWQQLIALAIINVFVWISESLFGYWQAVLWRNLAQTMEHEMRMDLYNHVQGLEMAWFEDTTSGGLLSVLNDDINQLERFLDRVADTIIQTFWNIVLVGAMFAFSSGLLTLVAFLPIPVIVFGSIRYQKRLEPFYARVREQVGELSSTLATNLGGIATIKAFAAEKRESKRVEKVSNDYREANREAIRYSSAFVPLIRMAILSGFTLTLVLGGKMALDGTMEVGVYSVLIFMTQRLLWPLTSLGETLDLYQRAMASVNRIFGLLDTEPTMKPGGTELPREISGTVTFENVNFGYGDGEVILDGISMTFNGGETHAIVGATGAGKSTIIRLLLRFYDVRSGIVAVDGIDVRDLSYDSLRKAIGYVSQDVFLFHGTVRDNIAYGHPDATQEEIEKAAQLAEADEFVRGLPMGYDTIVGERGQKLSGGQRQRISLARAILIDPPILVLDEATSAVDNETEAAIQRSLAVISKGRTVVVIAHRLSTVRDANRIWVLERGQVTEFGTHDELVAGAGLYSALWRVQTGEAIISHSN